MDRFTITTSILLSAALLFATGCTTVDESKVVSGPPAGYPPPSDLASPSDDSDPLPSAKEYALAIEESHGTLEGPLNDSSFTPSQSKLSKPAFSKVPKQKFSKHGKHSLKFAKNHKKPRTSKALALNKRRKTF